MAVSDLTIFGASGEIATSSFFVSAAAGFAWVCGTNTGGSLGTGDLASTLVPTQLIGPGWAKFAPVQNATVAVKTDGKLYSCGAYGSLARGYASIYDPNQTTFLQIGVDTDWTDVKACGQTVYAKKTSGALWGWGQNSFGQLGITGTTTTPRDLGVVVAEFSAGSNFAIVIKADGTMWGTGDNNSYQLGLGDTAARSVFTQIGIATTWSKISSGAYHTLALRTDGTLWSFGYSNYGELGLGAAASASVPTQIGVATTWTHVWCGPNNSYARKSDGTLYVWGQGGLGANARTLLGDLNVPTMNSSVAGAVALYPVGWAVFTRTASTVYGSGYNSNGELGVNDAVQRDAFTALVEVFISGATVNFSDSAAIQSSIVFSPNMLVSETALMLPESVSALVAANNAYSDSGAASDSLIGVAFTLYIESIKSNDNIAAGSNTTSSITDSAAMLDVIQQAINQVVADSAAGADSMSLGAALTLVDIADAVATQAPTYNSVILVAELIATLESFNSVGSEDIAETGALSDAYVARVSALVAMLEAAQAIDTNTALVHVMQSVADSADGATAITSAGSLINALLADSALVTIRLNIGGELFTGWVLNADTLAPSEYQFADLQFNSACKHSNTYLLAADDGIYQFTEDAGVETVMTYIKTGKTDFGSDLSKGVINAYMVYSASGQMTLKVTTSANGVLQTNDYAMVPFAATETPDPQRVTVGKGLKSRYWQFELTGANAGCTFDEIGMLPVVLSRRI